MLLQSLMVFRRRHNVSALALNGLNKYCSYIFGRNILLQNMFLNEVHAPIVAIRVGQLEWATIAIGVRHMGDAGHQGEEITPLGRFT
jgi:hypothetical protein